MLEDKALVWQLKHGNIDALRRVYEKYKHELLALALMLCRDRAASEDAVHHVFVSFAGATAELELRTNLRIYLLAHTANQVRDLDRSKEPSGIGLDELIPLRSGPKGSSHRIIRAEQARRISQALDELPELQREAVILHLQAEMKLRDVARAQGVSPNTAGDRYKHGLDSLESVQDNGSEKSETEELMWRFFQQKKAGVRTSEQMDRDIVDYALEAYVEARKKKFAIQGPDCARLF